MLTDIFADRYEKNLMWGLVEDVDVRFLTQGFRIVNEQLFPLIYESGEKNTVGKKNGN